MHKGNDESRQASKSQESQQNSEEDNWHPDDHDCTSIKNHWNVCVKGLF